MSVLMTKQNQVFIGIDVGTQGVRVIAADDRGEVLSAHKHSFPLSDYREEQSPAVWWSVVVSTLQSLAKELANTTSLQQIAALSVTSTSGTVIPLDRNFQPLHAALMYSDKRSEREATICRQASAKGTTQEPIPFNASYGLPKILWFVRNYPEKVEQIRAWCHAGDFITGNLSGIWEITDFTNALKTGYDLTLENWPSFIGERLGLPTGWFPQVVRSGRVLGPLSPKVSELTGLPDSILVVAGMTDGCASQIAAGSIRPGDWSTTIGTTMVLKGVTCRRIQDPLGRIYNHKHPQGFWMPGGASNTGADWVSQDYQEQDLPKLNQFAEKLIPTPWISYPLQQTGERFPFLSSDARGFDPQGLNPEQLYTARMEGVAYLERLSYELIEEISGETVDMVYTAGGASLSEVWLKIRSNVLQKPVCKMKHVEGAVGAAVIAASETGFGCLEEAARQMIQLEKTVEPGPLVAPYEERYRRFVESLLEKGYFNRTEGKP